MSYPVMPLGFLGSQGDNDTYRIERSLRFNSADSAYLSRTPASAGNRKTWTWSGWVKRGAVGTQQVLFAGVSSISNATVLRFTSDTLNFFNYVSGSFAGQLQTTAVYRDPSAWYHIVAVWDTPNATSGDRMRLYVNGSEVTVFTTDTAPTQNSDGFVNNTNANYVGVDIGFNAQYFNGYLTEINFIDGQALTPSSFGETDAITGRWKAKAYSGTYGTNGFYLKFADNSGTTATTLGKDSSPNGNNWTPNNFSVTAGAGNDSLVDSPTNYGTDSGVGGEVRGNYCTLNPIDRNTTATLSNGNLDFATATSGHNAIGTIGVSSGKWYWEAQTSAGTTEARATVFGTAASSYYSFAANNTAYGFRFDAGAGTLEYTANGSTWTSLATGLTSGPYFPFFNNNGTTSKTISVNFGQRPFAYTAPTGFKALCTTNLPTPTIQKPSSYMDVVTYTGTGSALTPTSSLGFSPDLVWIKGRSGATDHALYDAVRGAQLDMASNLSSAETTQSQGLTAFNSDGFSIGTLAKINTNTSTYVGWAWDAGEASSTNTAGSITSTVRVNPLAGVSIVSWTDDTSTNNRVGHGLGVAPAVVLYKQRNSAGDWFWTTTKIDGSFDRLSFNTGAKADISSPYTAPTSTTFSNYGSWGGATMIAYCFAEVEGFSKFGSYTGNGSADGPFVWCGFRPRWVMVKRTDAVAGWTILDTARSTENVMSNYINAESSAAEASLALFDYNSNGFKVRTTAAGINTSGGTWIFAAFAESPFKYARAR